MQYNDFVANQQLLFSELERLQQENRAIRSGIQGLECQVLFREQLECNPVVVAKMVEISTLKSLTSPMPCVFIQVVSEAE